MRDDSSPSPEDWLADEDAATRPSRASRLEFVVRSYGAPRHILFPGGCVSFWAFEEAKWSFVNGQFLACVLLCQVMLEHVLAGQYGLAGDDEAKRKGFKRLCDMSLADGRITLAEHNGFDLLRRLRNPYTHPRTMDDPERIERRAMNEQRPAEDILEEDARHALVAALRLTQRYPFGFPVDNEGPPEEHL